MIDRYWTWWNSGSTPFRDLSAAANASEGVAAEPLPEHGGLRCAGCLAHSAPPAVAFRFRRRELASMGTPRATHRFVNHGSNVRLSSAVAAKLQRMTSFTCRAIATSRWQNPERKWEAPRTRTSKQPGKRDSSENAGHAVRTFFDSARTFRSSSRMTHSHARRGFSGHRLKSSFFFRLGDQAMPAGRRKICARRSFYFAAEPWQNKRQAPGAVGSTCTFFRSWSTVSAVRARRVSEGGPRSARRALHAP